MDETTLSLITKLLSTLINVRGRIWSTGKAIPQSRLPGGALNWQGKLACYFNVWFTKRIQLPQASRDWPIWGDWPIWEEERWHLKAALKSFLGCENGKQKFDVLTKSLNECLYLPGHDFTHSESSLSPGSSHASSGDVFWVRREWDRENLVFQRCQCLCWQLYFSLGLATLSSLIRSW